MAYRRNNGSIFQSGCFCSLGKVTELLEKRVFRFVSIQFGKDNKGGEREICPGEKHCSDFESARGRNHFEKEKNACFGCEFFSSKSNTESEAIEKRIASAIDQAAMLRRRRDSGFPLDERKMTSIVYDTLLLLDEVIDRFERVMRIQNNKYLEFLLKRPTF